MNTPPPPLETVIDWRVVAGLDRMEGPTWKRVQMAQATELLRLLPLTCVAFVLAVLTIVSIYTRSVPAAVLLPWAAANIALLLSHRERKAGASVASPRSPTATRGVCRNVALGLLWALPPILFAAGATAEHQLTTCLTCVALMALVTITTAPAPGLLICYLVPAASGVSVMMAMAGSPILAALPLCYAAMLAMGGMTSGRAFIRRLWAEYALEEKTEVVRLLLREFEDAGADWLWQVDGSKRLTDVSPRFAKAAGRAAAEMEGLSLVDLLTGAVTSEANGAALRQLVEMMNGREGFSDLVFEVAVGDGMRWWSISAAPRWDAHGTFEGFRGVGSDITEQRQSAERMDRMARIDVLTGLPNRREFMEQLRLAVENALRNHEPCALLLIDLDKFKPVNDTLGHQAGDRLLKVVAERLRRVAGPQDLCGRLGGDEFAIMLGRVDPSSIERVGQAVVSVMGTPFEIDGDIISIGASVGSAIAPRDGRSIETLVRNADLALYRAKHDGRGTLRRYDPSLRAQEERRRAIETALRQAIDSGDQFHLVYQPIVAAGDGTIRSFEAFIRWHHPSFGDVPPADFLPIAEEARLAGRIGEWVLRTACIEAGHWPDGIGVSVNLATEQLHDPQLSTKVLSALAHSGLSPHRLELEVSESAFLAGNARIPAVLDALRRIGVRIVLDDFGVALTQLGHIRDKLFSAIKVDMRFVQGAAAGDRDSLAIVRAGVAIADAFGIATVAEGAESALDLSSMRALGIDGIQGHLAGSPLPSAETRALLDASDTRAGGVRDDDERSAA